MLYYPFSIFSVPDHYHNYHTNNTCLPALPCYYFIQDDSDDEGPASSSSPQAGDGATVTSGEGQLTGAPSKETLGDFQELLLQARCLMMELTKDVATAALLAEQGMCDGVIRLLRIAATTTCR